MHDIIKLKTLIKNTKVKHGTEKVKRFPQKYYGNEVKDAGINLFPVGKSYPWWSKSNTPTQMQDKK